MDWHSTQGREELLIALEGLASVEVQVVDRSIRRRALRAGQCLFLPTHTWHRVINRTLSKVRYLYVTAPLSRASC